MTKYLLRAIFLSQTNPVVTTKKKKFFLIFYTEQERSSGKSQNHFSDKGSNCT